MWHVYDKDAQKVKELLFDRHGFEVDQEIAAQLLAEGKVAYAPIRHRQRLGKAKAPTWRRGLKALFAIFGVARRNNPEAFFGLFAAVALIPAAILLGLVAWPYIFDNRLFQFSYLLTNLILFVVGGQGLTVATIGYTHRSMERKFSGTWWLK